MRVIVIGAGVVGAATAFMLAEAGHDVVLLEREATAAQHTSRSNGAQLSYSFVEPLARPEALWSILGAFIKPSPSLRVAPRLDRAFLAWGLQFLANCTPAGFEANARAAFALAEASRRALAEIRRTQTLAFDYAERGKLVLYGSPAALRRAAALADIKSECGLDVRVLDADACIDLEPALEGFQKRYAGGVYAPDDAIGDAAQFASCLLRESRRIELQFGCTVRGLVRKDGLVAHVDTDRGPVGGDLYVLCAGPWSTALARTAGVRLPLALVKGYSLTVRSGPGCPQTSITDAGRRMVYARLGDRLRVAGYAEIGARSAHPVDEGVRHLLSAAREAFPSAGDYDEPVDRWAGLRPMTPQGTPIVGQTHVRNLFVNVGHGPYGWTWACGAAQALTSAIDDAV